MSNNFIPKIPKTTECFKQKDIKPCDYTNSCNTDKRKYVNITKGILRNIERNMKLSK